MKPILIRSSEGFERKISETYSVKNMLAKQECENVSVAVSTANRHKETTKSSGSDRVYYIIEGELKVEPELSAKKGDLIFIPKNTEYTFSGTFKAVLINAPAFSSEKEKIKRI
jgi:ethanolamine utilization protein EutQ (cupin superfamily)